MNHQSSSSSDPDGPDRIRRAVAKMILGFPLTGSEPSLDVAAAYVSELASLPPEAVEEACQRFSRGLIERKAMGLRPGIDLVYQEAASIADRTARAARLRLPAPERDRPPTPEEQAAKHQRTTELLAKWAKRDLERVQVRRSGEAG